MGALADPFRKIDGATVYRKSELGLDQLARPHGPWLSALDRQLLILMDGERTVAELSKLFGAETAWKVTAGLEQMGFAERADAPPPAAADEADETRDALLDLPVEFIDDPQDRVRHRLRHSRLARAWRQRPGWSRDWFLLVNLAMLAVVLVMAACLVVISRQPPDPKPPPVVVPDRAGAGVAGRSSPGRPKISPSTP